MTGWWRRACSAFTCGGARGVAIQLVVLICVVLFLSMVAANVALNLQRLGIKTGFNFLSRPAGFDISQTLIHLDENTTYLTTFVVALLNTLLVTVLSIVFATLLGFTIALARRSSNGAIAAAASLYVETFRNIPLLIQLLFWYFAILQPMPGPRGSLSLFGLVFLNNRGLFVPAPEIADDELATLVMVCAGVCVAIACFLAVRYRRPRTGHASWPWRAVGFIALGVSLAFLFFGHGLGWSVPRLEGFNFKGGVSISPELFALTLGLSIYSAAFIAEILRSGMNAIPRGQIDAARALGLTVWQIARLIVIPLALRVIVPPLGAYYVILLKNSSLGSVIAYPDLMHVFAGTVLNQTSQPIEVMSITLATYLLLGLAMSSLTNVTNKWLRR
jgi:general L-amino acid transport system permease protein